MVHVAEKLLDDFRALPGRVERPRTFMEIAGYPHYENVCSNILAFFMDPEEAHGLGTLVLDALVGAIDRADASGGVGGSISVKREVFTDLGNRIDLLIESDGGVILIENKIYAIANNPFNDYTNYLDRAYSDRANRKKILLTLYPTNEGSKWGFTDLAYEVFVRDIRSLLGSYVSGADARYLMMFLDFLNTLESLRRGTGMDREFVKLLAKRSDDIRHLFADLKIFRSELRNKVEALESLVDASHYPNVEQYCWRPTETVAMYDNLRQDIRVSDDLVVKVDTRITPSGWRILYSTHRKGDRLKLRGVLQDLDIPIEEDEWFIHRERFSYDESPDQIRPIVKELVDKLATSRKHGA